MAIFDYHCVDFQKFALFFQKFPCINSQDALTGALSHVIFLLHQNFTPTSDQDKTLLVIPPPMYFLFYQKLLEVKESMDRCKRGSPS